MKQIAQYGTVSLLTVVWFAAAHAAATGVVWEHKESGTVAVVRSGVLTVTSAKHGYRLTLPHGGSPYEYGWSWTTPLRVRTERYVAVIREVPRNGMSATDYLLEAMSRLKEDPTLLVSAEEILPHETRPVLRYMVKLKETPEFIEEPNYLRWNYLTALPKPSSWLVLHLSTSGRAKPGKPPKDQRIVRMMRTALSIDAPEQ